MNRRRSVEPRRSFRPAILFAAVVLAVWLATRPAPDTPSGPPPPSRTGRPATTVAPATPPDPSPSAATRQAATTGVTSGVTFVLEPGPDAPPPEEPEPASPSPSPVLEPEPEAASPEPPSPEPEPPGDRSSVGGIPVPAGWRRELCEPGSFGEWLRGRRVKKGRRILDFRGGEIRNAGFDVLAVVDTPLLFREDLEQCADFCMRFWAEYHRAAGRLDRLYLFDYDGRKVRFGKDPKAYRGFLRRAFSNTNSWSLKRGCGRVTPSDLAPGDMFVQNLSGGIGHASMIVDACRNDAGARLFLVGFSFMPAQEFHIERAGKRDGQDGWFTVEGYRRFLEESFPPGEFGEPVLRRFEPLARSPEAAAR